MRRRSDRSGNPFLAARGVLRHLIPVMVLLAAAAPAPGQQNENIAANPSLAYNTVLMALNSGDYEKGLDIINEVVVYWGDRGKEQFGPGFGHFYYLRGLLYMGLGSYEEAIEAFRVCYEDFPNTLLGNTNAAEKTQLANRFRIHSLAQWGASLMTLDHYDEAIKILEKALAESKGSRVRIDIVGINLGRSYLRNGDLAKGKKLLLQALDSETLGPDLKRKAFMILAEDWSREVAFDEVREILWKYGDIVRQDTRANRWSRNPVFAFLARNGLQHHEPLRALTWYSFLLNPQELVAHHQKRLADLVAAKPIDDADAARLQTVQEFQRTEIEAARKMLAATLLGVGSGHYQLQNFSGAYAGFRHLCEAFPQHTKRPEALYNLIASCVQLTRWREVRTFGAVFLDDYPDHFLVPEVARMMVESIFILQEWQEAFTTAAQVRERFEIGSVARDVPDFVAGASLYHLDRYPEAEAELTDYLENYPEARRLEPATYYHGSTKVKLYKWREGVDILEHFMTTWPESELLSSALYQAALCRFVLEELDDAEAKVDRLHAQFPEADEIPASWNLKGDILTARGEMPLGEIESAYLRAKELSAGDPVHFETAAYSLWKLVLLHDEVRQFEEAAAYYDEFKGNYPGSIHQLDTLAAALRPLAETGRAAEAEATLHEQILNFAGDAENAHLSELFGSYLDFLDQNYGPDEVLSKIQNFPAPDPVPGPLRAWLIVAEIERLESKKDPPPAEELEEKLFEIQLGIPRDETPNYGLIKLARWNLEQKSYRERARELYEFVLNQRPDGGHLELAMVDLGKLLARSEDEADLDRAFEYFKTVREEYEIPELQEDAVAGAGRILSARGQWAEAETWWRDYLDHRSWMSVRPEANFEFGRCLEETGRKPEAIKVYVNVYINFPGRLDWSTRAYLRTARLLKADGKDGDALLVLIDMLKRLGHLEHRNLEEGRKLFRDWKAEWVAKN